MINCVESLSLLPALLEATFWETPSNNFYYRFPVDVKMYFYECHAWTSRQKWQASHLLSYNQSLCLSFSDREGKSTHTFFSSRSCIGFLTWWMSPVKRGFVAFRQLLAFNTHLHNSICVCDFPFGKLLALSLALLKTERDREKDTVTYCRCTVIAQLCELKHVPRYTGER